MSYGITKKIKQRNGLGNMSSRGSAIFIYVDFSSQTMDAKRQLNDIFKIQKAIQLLSKRIIHQMKTSSKNE